MFPLPIDVLILPTAPAWVVRIVRWWRGRWPMGRLRLRGTT
jgi:hypothetical protein